MADKKITDLQLISALSDTVNVPGDDTIQTYRFTMLQVAKYLNQTRTISAAATSINTTDRIVFLDPTSAGFTQSLPAVASFPTNVPLTLKNIATNGNEVTLDGNSSELIDNALTLVLGSDPVMESVTLINNGSKWLIL